MSAWRLSTILRHPLAHRGRVHDVEYLDVSDSHSGDEDAYQSHGCVTRHSRGHLCHPERTLKAPRARRERHVILHKEKRTVLVGLNFAICESLLPPGFSLNQAVVFSIRSDTSAARANINCLDVVTEIEGVRVKSAHHAINLIHNASGCIRVKIRQCPVYLIKAAARIQRAWRQSKAIFRLEFHKQCKTSKFGLVFDPTVSNAAIVSEVNPAFPLHEKLSVGDAVLFVNNTLVTTPAQAAQAICDAGTNVVLICMKGQDVDQSILCHTPGMDDSKHFFRICDDCPICFEPLVTPVEWIAGCGHCFCAKCHEKSSKFSDACPICRATLRSRAAACALLRG